MRSRIQMGSKVFLVCALVGLVSGCTGFRSGPAGKTGSGGKGLGGASSTGSGGKGGSGTDAGTTGTGGNNSPDAGSAGTGGVGTAGTGGTGGSAGSGTAGTGGGVGPGTGGVAPTDAGGGTDTRDAGSMDVACGSPTDVKNCGTCGHDCTALTNVTSAATGVECRAGACYVPAAACVAGYGHCSARADDGCEASLTDSSNCGVCGTKCSGATALCTQSGTTAKCASSCVAPAPDLCVSSCVDLKTDARNCGTCGHDCGTLPNVKPGATGIECRVGACYVPAAACVVGYGHCSTRADDGCETPLTTPTNCGQCGKACTSPTGLCSTTGTATCSSSCASPSPDLCTNKCVSLASDPTNCGACNHNCTTLPNVKAGATGIECRSGVCYVPPSACASGRAHCSTKPDDGCEADLSTPATCGSCSLVCSGSTPLCSLQSTPATCLPSCSGTSPDVCGTKCVNKMTDAKNCGVCGHDCGALMNVKAGATAPAVQCVAGLCSIQPAGCTTGFGHCTTTADDGCETNLTQPAHCGTCANACTAPTALCSTTGASPACASSCVSPNPDLCVSKCVNKATDPTNCGTCGHDCTKLAGIGNTNAVSCNSTGGCVVPQSACTAGSANCSSNANDTDGCETKTNTNTNCGGCGVTCGITNGVGDCSTGTCSKSCNTGYYLCNNTTCIANTAQCGGLCGASGYQACGTTCISSSGCCAPSAAAAHYVDGVSGVDAEDHGGPGACAYKTIGYALARATGTIALSLATYSSEAWPLVLIGTQQLLCNPAGTGRATIKMTQLLGSYVIKLSGTQNGLTDCIISGNINPVVCVDVTAAAPSTASPHLLKNLDIGDCNSAGVIAEDNVSNVRLQGSTVHGSNIGVLWKPGSSGQVNTNSFTNTTDIICSDTSPVVSGSGNADSSQAGGKPTCSTCVNCATF